MPRALESRARILGHPIHPMIVVFPLGLLPVALLFDAAYIYFRDPFWWRAAFSLLGLGVLGIVGAAIPGLIDFFTAIPASRREAVKTGRRHMASGFALLVLFAVVLAIHWRPGAVGAWPWIALAISGAGNILLVYQAATGGSLTYAHHVGSHSVAPDEEPAQALPPLKRRRLFGRGRPRT